MDWNPNVRNFVSRPDMASFNFLYSYNYDHYPGMDTKQAGIGDAVLGQGMMGPDINYGININGSSHEKKKRLTSEQLDSLENSFQEDIKLEPDRKMKLSRELGLQPRQIAVWFQNRRARWKAKQLERLYDSLKQEFDVVSKEKQKLLDEVMKLRGIIREQAVGGSRKQQVSTTGQTAEMSAGEETVESTSVAIGSYGVNNNNNKPIRSTAATTNQHQHGVIGMNGDHQQCCNYLLNLTVDHDHTNVNAAAVSTPYWALLPPNSYPLNN